MRSNGPIPKSFPLIFDLSLFLPLLAACYWWVLAGLAAQWIDDPNYTHGLFIVPMAGVLAWRRRKKLALAAAKPSALGYALLVGGGVIYLLGIAAAELFTMRFSVVTTFAGLVLLTQGRGRTRILLFPLCFLLLMVPIPYIFYYKLTFPLQLMSSRLTAGVLASVGMPVVRTGNVINLEHYSLEVVTACSGLRSIMTLGAMSIFISDFFRFGTTTKIVFVLFTIPVAVAANTARLLTTAVVSAIGSPETADSFMHDVSGALVFLFGLMGLLLVGVILEWITKKRTA